MRCVMWDTHVRLLRETTHNSNTLCCAACFMSTDIHWVSYPVFWMYQVDTGILKMSIKSVQLLTGVCLRKNPHFSCSVLYLSTCGLMRHIHCRTGCWLPSESGRRKRYRLSHPAGGGGGCLGRPSIWWLNPAPGTPYHNVGRKMFREINTWQNVVFIQ